MSYTTPHGEVRHFGRVRPAALPQVLRLRSYLSEANKPPPEIVDYLTKAAQAIQRMYLNDRYGCCVIASLAHQLGLWSANDGAPIIMATDQEIYSQYQSVCGPGDNGCNIANVLNYAKANGFKAGGKTYKIDGYVAVDNANKLEVQTAIYLFGSLKFGFNLPKEWANSRGGAIWDSTNSPFVGGHDVCAVGYNATGVVIASWGQVFTITWRALANGQIFEEVYAELAPAWYGSDKLAPCGLDAATLVADLAKIGGGVIPPIDIPPIVPPTPPIVPPVVPPVVPPFPPTPHPFPAPPANVLAELPSVIAWLQSVAAQTLSAD